MFQGVIANVSSNAQNYFRGSLAQQLGLPSWLPGWAVLLVVGGVFIVIGIAASKVIRAAFIAVGIIFVFLAGFSALAGSLSV